RGQKNASSGWSPPSNAKPTLRYLEPEKFLAREFSGKSFCARIYSATCISNVGALRPDDVSGLFAHDGDESMSEKKPPRDHVSVRLDPDVAQALRQRASIERRSVSNVLRNIAEDWARSNQEGVAA